MYFSVEKGHTLEQAADGANLVTMGINPSKGNLHEGHYITMYQAMKALRSQQRARGHFFVDDREFDWQKRSIDDESVFLLPSTATAEAIQQRMWATAGYVAGALDDPSLLERITIERMSDYMRRDGGGLYEFLQKHRKDIDGMFEFDRNEFGKRNFIRPICPECRHGPRLDDVVGTTASSIHAKCARVLCPHQEYAVHPSTGENHWAIHYAVDPLRDALLSADHDYGKVLHVFGGDYGLPWGRSQTPKAERLQLLLAKIAPLLRINHFVGPMLKRDGQKLAKSNGDAGSLMKVSTLEAILQSKKPFVDLNHLARLSTIQR